MHHTDWTDLMRSSKKLKKDIDLYLRWLDTTARLELNSSALKSNQALTTQSTAYSW